LPSKTEAFIGFAIKSGNVLFGVDSTKRNKGKIYLIIISSDLSENSKKTAAEIAKRHNSPMLICGEGGVERAVHKTNCKFIAIKDKNLSEAIIKSALENDREFKLYPWEEN